MKGGRRVACPGQSTPTDDRAAREPAPGVHRIYELIQRAREEGQRVDLTVDGDPGTLPGTAAGRRDLAMLTLLARLGLRAGEVAALTLDDIDWRAGEITVHGKGRRSERLPLPADAGEAIAAYLRDGRPEPFESTRRVSLRVRAPTRMRARQSRPHRPGPPE